MWFKLSVWKHYISYVTSIIYFFFFFKFAHFFVHKVCQSQNKNKKTLSSHSPESFLWSTTEAWHAAANANAHEQRCEIQIHHC